MENLINDYKNGMDINSICEKYHFGKLKVKKILTDNGVEIRKRGGQCKNKPYVVQDWKIEKYPPIDGYHYIAVSKCGDGFTTSDYMNSAGVMTTYIKNKFGVDTPTLYDRREYYKLNGNYWWEQWFGILKEKNLPTKKCPYCDWETVDVENKSGMFETHLKNEHNKTVDEYLNEYPTDEDYFKSYIKKKKRAELFLNDKYYVTCPLCGEKMKKITLWHCKSKHNMTLGELKKQFTDQKIVSDYTQEIDNNNFKLGNLTVSKNRFISRYEMEIQNFLKEKGVEFDANRQILVGKEIDILVQALRIGIEFDGLKHHTEYFGKKNRMYHLSKTLKCNEKGYGLIHIFEDEFVNHKDVVFSKLAHILHLNENLPKICGRKIEIKEIYKNDAMLFLNQYHIQGFTSSTIYLGGFYNGQLVAVMTFKHGNAKNPNWDLTRFATDFHYRYQGVASKMFTYFVKKYNPQRIVSFADRRWTINKNYNLYTILGFDLESENAPDYRYYNEKIDRYKRFHKMSLNKKILHNKYGFPLEMTEREMTRELGFDRIWDCGLFKYVWVNKKGQP